MLAPVEVLLRSGGRCVAAWDAAPPQRNPARRDGAISRTHVDGLVFFNDFDDQIFPVNFFDEIFNCFTDLVINASSLYFIFANSIFDVVRGGVLKWRVQQMHALFLFVLLLSLIRAPLCVLHVDAPGAQLWGLVVAV